MRRKRAGCAVTLGAEVRVVPSFKGISEGIVLASKEAMDQKTDSVYVFPLCQEDFDNVRIVAQGFDWKALGPGPAFKALRTRVRV